MTDENQEPIEKKCEEENDVSKSEENPRFDPAVQSNCVVAKNFGIKDPKTLKMTEKMSTIASLYEYLVKVIKLKGLSRFFMNQWDSCLYLQFDTPTDASAAPNKFRFFQFTDIQIIPTPEFLRKNSVWALRKEFHMKRAGKRQHEQTKAWQDELDSKLFHEVSLKEGETIETKINSLKEREVQVLEEFRDRKKRKSEEIHTKKATEFKQQQQQTESEYQSKLEQLKSQFDGVEELPTDIIVDDFVKNSTFSGVEDAVGPLQNYKYSTQCVKKNQENKQAFLRFAFDLAMDFFYAPENQKNGWFPDWLKQLMKTESKEMVAVTTKPSHKKKFSDMLAIIDTPNFPYIIQETGGNVSWEGLLPSKEPFGYRNNCEFTCGFDLEGKPNIGFLFGGFDTGRDIVGHPFRSKLISPEMKRFCYVFTEFLKRKEPEGFNCRVKGIHKGFFRIVKVRQNLEKELLIITQVDPTGFSAEQMLQIQQDLKNYLLQFDELTPKENKPAISADQIDETMKKYTFKIRGICMQEFAGISDKNESQDFKLIHGQDFLVENLCGLSFEISPFAFFQVNTSTGNTLFDTLSEWIKTSCPEETTKKSVLLDFFCGTGNIGNILAKATGVKAVLGVDNNKQAIVNANANAKKFGNDKIANFIHETLNYSTLKTILYGLDVKHDFPPMLAILDPPRSGIGVRFCHCVVERDNIERFYYVSCNPTTLYLDLKALCGIKQGSERGGGRKYGISRICAVDMFPHTNHVEHLVELVKLKKK